jgi:hypothetical protein
MNRHSSMPFHKTFGDFVSGERTSCPLYNLLTYFREDRQPLGLTETCDIYYPFFSVARMTGSHHFGLCSLLTPSPSRTPHAIKTNSGPTGLWVRGLESS